MSIFRVLLFSNSAHGGICSADTGTAAAGGTAPAAKHSRPAERDVGRLAALWPRVRAKRNPLLRRRLGSAGSSRATHVQFPAIRPQSVGVAALARVAALAGATYTLVQRLRSSPVHFPANLLRFRISNRQGEWIRGSNTSGAQRNITTGTTRYCGNRSCPRIADSLRNTGPPFGLPSLQCPVPGRIRGSFSPNLL